MQLNYIQAFTLNRTSLDLVSCMTQSPALCSPSDVREVVPSMEDIMFFKEGSLCCSGWHDSLMLQGIISLQALRVLLFSFREKEGFILGPRQRDH